MWEKPKKISGQDGTNTAGTDGPGVWRPELDPSFSEASPSDFPLRAVVRAHVNREASGELIF